ncbi:MULTISPECIES: hypothetical protein [unclassified Streptomyces]|uniref:hypothetical protein n=1 Tax=unclassified Streptomyces TaxID=2593676 RepID=UPI002259DFD4|nr:MULTISPECIES: hypothetical protein [unclassified Streptomyces]MCX5054611.1 hypothetical protein [Streptomyces sp. NBC_00474]
MTADVFGVDAWLGEITAQARKSQSRVFSVSVPVNHPEAPQEVPEHLLAAAIEGVEGQGWQLDSVSTYGAAFPRYIDPLPYEAGPRFWALLIFRTTYRGQA